MTPIVYLDTETDGLHHGRKAWEVAMIREDDGGVRERQFFVGIDLRSSDPAGLQVGGFWDRHPAGRKMSGKTTDGVPCPPVLSKHDAAREVMSWTFGAVLVGVGTHFDAETLAGLLRAEGYVPSWHYALVDVKSMGAGFLLAHGKGQPEPWVSDELARACGVEPPSDEDRHTALGDARWARRWFHTMTGRSVQ